MTSRRALLVRATGPNGRSDETAVVAGREQVQVPAGRFDAFRVVGEGFQGAGNRRRFVNWVAPQQVRRAVARDLDRWDTRLGATSAPSRQRVELVSFFEKVPPGEMRVGWPSSGD